MLSIRCYKGSKNPNKTAKVFATVLILAVSGSGCQATEFHDNGMIQVTINQMPNSKSDCVFSSRIQLFAIINKCLL